MSTDSHSTTVQDQMLVNQPNLWAGLMRFVCDLLILMYVVGNPFYRFVSELAVTLCHTLLDLSLSLSLSLSSER